MRRLITATAATTVAALGLMIPSAVANEPGCDDRAALQHAIDVAESDVVSARETFRDSRRPLGQLLKETRAAARTEARTSRAALHDLIEDAREAASRQESRDLRAAIRTERRELRDARRLLEDKRALLDETKVGRRQARADFKEARTALRELREVAAGCDEPAEETDPATTDPATTEPAPGEATTA